MSGPGSDDEARKPIAVFLLDDHEVVRRGVRDMLEAEPDIRVVGEAGTAASALARIPALKPDVAVLDVRLPDGDGVSVCREIRSRMPEVACLMLTSFGDDEALFDAIMAGAAGYVLKQIRGTDLVGAVRTVASGQSMLDPRAASQLMARLRDQSAKRDPLAGLTAQERRILELIGDGLTNRQIGERMFLAEKTVKNYVSALFAKLGMERRTQAAAYAVRAFGDQHEAGRAITAVPTSRDLLPWAPRRRPGILGVMYSDASALPQLSRDECLPLMASVPVGRISFFVSEQGTAAIWGQDASSQAEQIITRIAHPRVRDELRQAGRELGFRSELRPGRQPRGTRHSRWVPGAGARIGSLEPSSPPSFSARRARLRRPLRLPSAGMPVPLSVTWTASMPPPSTSTVTSTWLALGVPGGVGQRLAQRGEHLLGHLRADLAAQARAEPQRRGEPEQRRHLIDQARRCPRAGPAGRAVTGLQREDRGADVLDGLVHRVHRVRDRGWRPPAW